MSGLRFSARARADAFAIWDGLANSGDRFGTSPVDPVDSAEAFAARLAQACRAVVADPASGTAREDLGVDLYEFDVGSFRLFYRRGLDVVDVVRVVQAAFPD